MTILECRVGLLQDLFPGNCAGFFNVKRNQPTRGWGRTGIEPGTLWLQSQEVSHYAMGPPPAPFALRRWPLSSLLPHDPYCRRQLLFLRRSIERTDFSLSYEAEKSKTDIRCLLKKSGVLNITGPESTCLSFSGDCKNWGLLCLVHHFFLRRQRISVLPILLRKNRTGVWAYGSGW